VNAGRRANLLAVAGGVLVAVVLLELLLRVLPLRDPSMTPAFQNPPWQSWADPAWGNPAPEAYRAAPTIGYEHAPDLDVRVPLAARPAGSFELRTNERGLRRDGATAVPKPPGRRRVLVLGDSHTDGYVDNAESFSTLLETALGAARGADGVDVLNAGVVGYSPVQEVLWYERHAVELAPDVVLLVLYAGNDVMELSDPSKPAVDDVTGAITAPAEAPPAGAAGPGRFGPHDRLDALRIVRWTRAAVRYGPLAPFWQRWHLPGRVTQVGEYRTDTLVAVLRTCHGCFYQSLQQAAFVQRHPDDARRNLDRIVGLVGHLAGEAATRNARLVVALLPTRAQVEPERAHEERARTAALLALGPTDLAFEDVVLVDLARRLDAASIAVVPLLEPLRRAAAAEPQYYPRDWHLAPPGHRTVAAALVPSVTSSLTPASDQASR
jgi:hypothetical protein